MLVVDLLLHVVGREHHDDVGGGRGVGDGVDLEAGVLHLGPAAGAGVEADDHVAAGVAQVEGVGVTLRAKADHGDLLVLEQVKVGVGVVVHLGGHTGLLGVWVAFWRLA